MDSKPPTSLKLFHADSTRDRRLIVTASIGLAAFALRLSSGALAASELCFCRTQPPVEP